MRRAAPCPHWRRRRRAADGWQVWVHDAGADAGEGTSTAIITAGQGSGTGAGNPPAQPVAVLLAGLTASATTTLCALRRAVMSLMHAQSQLYRPIQGMSMSAARKDGGTAASGDDTWACNGSKSNTRAQERAAGGEQAKGEGAKAEAKSSAFSLDSDSDSADDQEGGGSCGGGGGGSCGGGGGEGASHDGSNLDLPFSTVATHLQASQALRRMVWGAKQDALGMTAAGQEGSFVDLPLLSADLFSVLMHHLCMDMAVVQGPPDSCPTSTFKRGGARTKSRRFAHLGALYTETHRMSVALLPAAVLQAILGVAACVVSCYTRSDTETPHQHRHQHQSQNQHQGSSAVLESFVHQRTPTCLKEAESLEEALAWAIQLMLTKVHTM